MAFTSSTQAQHERYLYYNKQTHASPTWTLIENARNVGVSKTKDDVDVSRRGGGGHVLNRPGMATTELTFEYVYLKGTDTVFADLLTSYNSGQDGNALVPYEFWDADGLAATATTKGWRAVMYVSEMTKDGDDGTEEVWSITLKLCDAIESSALLKPDWYDRAA